MKSHTLDLFLIFCNAFVEAFNLIYLNLLVSENLKLVLIIQGVACGLMITIVLVVLICLKM